MIRIILNIETSFVKHIAHLKDCKDMKEYVRLLRSGDNIIKQLGKIDPNNSMIKDLKVYREDKMVDIYLKTKDRVNIKCKQHNSNYKTK